MLTTREICIACAKFAAWSAVALALGGIQSAQAQERGDPYAEPPAPVAPSPSDLLPQQPESPAPKRPQPQAAPPSAQPPAAATPRQAPSRMPSPTAEPSSSVNPFAGAEDLFAQAGPRSRLASAPDMFGDFFGRGATLFATDSLAVRVAPPLIATRADVALAGGARGLKVGEHNKALPVDRVYFNYNHYHNALQFRTRGLNPTPAPGVPFAAARDLSLDRYTLGWEKTFACGLGSVELRMPFTGGYDLDFRAGDPNGVVTLEGGHVGNLAIIPKLLLYEDEQTAVAVGVGIEAPTGSDAEARVAFTAYRLENEAVHLHPYLGILAHPTDDFFAHAFVQIDVAANGNPVEFAAVGGAPGAGTFGVYNEQTLLHVDLSLGHWLYRDPCAPWLTGLACLAEWHYTTALEDTDVVAGARATVFPPGATLNVRNRVDRFDVVNFTAGLHAEILNDTTLRVGGAFPLGGGADRFFDAEVIAQLCRRY